ncbi:hypothetical protein M0R04_15775 [Candidatus Dojkabacteria bacterium]|jgi:hypothetical protein|nr:hypothetical protein [Candidatus Dojkabacteria bacterium]
MTGLTLNVKEFECLPQKQKLTCLFENQCTTIRLISSYKTYYKLTAIIGAFLLTGMGILFKMHIE